MRRGGGTFEGQKKGSIMGTEGLRGRRERVRERNVPALWDAGLRAIIVFCFCFLFFFPVVRDL